MNGIFQIYGNKNLLSISAAIIKMAFSTTNHKNFPVDIFETVTGFKRNHKREEKFDARSIKKDTKSDSIYLRARLLRVGLCE